ncbi:MAG: arylsulfatase [Saprospiraceae bacterium]
MLLSYWLVSCTTISSPGDPPPNVLLILLDDMGFGDINFAGNELLQTPHLNALQQESVSFEQFYVSPVCAPTRASLLTGRYHQRGGVRSVTNGFETLHPDETTLAELLQQAGYRTGLFGKWHLGEYYPSVPNAQGFDEFLGFRTGHTADYYDATLEHNGQLQATSGYITDVLTEEALAFMTQTSNSPFFCYLSYNAPHTPLLIDSSYFLPFLEKGLDERTARVYGMMENLDENIGQLLSALDLSNTLVLFLSDNGPINGWKVAQEKMRYNAGLRDQKFTTFEGGIRTQCLWRWDKHWDARVVKETAAAHIDILPTLMSQLNLSIPDQLEIDGMDLSPLLLGQTAPRLQERFIFQNYHLETVHEPAPYPGGVAIQGPWKMVDGKMLYYLKDDPGESQNLADQLPDKLAQMQNAYERWWVSLSLTPKQFGMQIPVGHPAENPVFLQPHHGLATGQLQFTGQRGLLGENIGTHPSGVDGDWLANWSSEKDGITWLIDVQVTSDYEIGISSRGQLGDEVPVQLKSGSQVRNLMLTTNDRPEVWQDLLLTQLHLAKGIDTLTFRLSEMVPANNFELRALWLRRK